MTPLRRDGGSVGRCLPPPLMAAHSILAVVDGAIAALAFFQLLRIHLRSQHLGWTRQKMFHLMIGSSNIGFFTYFLCSLLATCGGWRCWPHGCGFIFMACPQILFLAAFLLLLSFCKQVTGVALDSYWSAPNSDESGENVLYRFGFVGQTNDEDEDDDDNSYSEALLEKSKAKPGLLTADGRRRCCSFRTIHIGSRQKFVILVIMLIFVFMIAFALLIWLGRGKNPIDSSFMARVYLDVFSVAILVLGCALACYGLLLFSKMRRVRSEMVSTEIWKVASLAAVSVVSFTSSALVALVTNIPLQVHCYWILDRSESANSSIFSFLYYFIALDMLRVGSSVVPSALVLWVMREMPPRVAPDRPSQSRVVSFVRDSTTATHNPQWRSAVTSSQTKVLKASPI